MKNLIAILLLAFVLAGTPSCSITPKQAAFTSLATSRAGVDLAWQGFRNQRALGKVSDKDWIEGVRAVQSYKDARSAVIKIAKTSDGSQALDTALGAVALAYDPVYKILNRYVPELLK